MLIIIKSNYHMSFLSVPSVISFSGVGLKSWRAERRPCIYMHVCWSADGIAFLVEELVDELLVHGLVEGDLHRGVLLHAERSRAVEDVRDCVPRD